MSGRRVSRQAPQPEYAAVGFFKSSQQKTGLAVNGRLALDVRRFRQIGCKQARTPDADRRLRSKATPTPSPRRSMSCQTIRLLYLPIVQFSGAGLVHVKRSSQRMSERGPDMSKFLPIRPDWLNMTSEPVLDPDLPIIDAHHHLW